MQKFLIIQTAFIGDVILATGLVESIRLANASAQIDVLVRKGNESLFIGHPYIHNVITWDKKKNKIAGLASVIRQARKSNYDYLINLHRFFSSGLITAFSKAKQKRGFDKNPLSFLFSKKYKHVIGEGHETERNFELVKDIPGISYSAPRLYPSPHAMQKEIEPQSYVCFAPASVWFTKQLPVEKWIALANKTSPLLTIFLLGAPSDRALCEKITAQSTHPSIKILCGELSLLQSAALIQQAHMNYVNDSAPLHLASSVNAPVTAFFCSTVPSFGFGPLSEVAMIKQTTENLSCRPCGLHGYKKCPLGHFKCGFTIEV